jgi:ribosome maturation protein Sdo1
MTIYFMFREGVEKDLDEVLQSHTVFTNVRYRQYTKRGVKSYKTL